MMTSGCGNGFKTGFETRFGLSGLAVLALLLSASALAQEPDELDAYEPGVDTSAPLAAEDAGREDATAEAEEAATAAAAARAAEDIRRRATSSGVMDEMDLGRTEITGNQELPKVLYIVPWQKSDPGDLMGRPVNTLLDEVLAPLNRDEFVRQVDYYGDLHGKPDEE